MRAWIIWIVAFAALVAPSMAACPNKCSGHGKCELNDVCNCMQNWMGGDCSQRVCPYQRAWHDTAVADNDAHSYAECSNRGACDRDGGLCICDQGFSGSGCRRMVCPENCNGHGTCELIEDLAKDSFDRRIAGSHARVYSIWDQEKIMGCKCDPWWEGHSCSKRVCPKGDDPLTPSQNEMVQAVRVADAVQFYLTYFDPYGNAYTTSMIASTAGDSTTTCASISTALRRLPNNVLNTVTVASATNFMPFVRSPATSASGTVGTQVAQTGGTDHICLITFRSEPGQTGLQHLLECNANPHATIGQHPRSTGAASGLCVVAEAYPQGTAGAATRTLTELAECSNRGTCDRTTGVCLCFAGHMGLACERQEALV